MRVRDVLSATTLGLAVVMTGCVGAFASQPPARSGSPSTAHGPVETGDTPPSPAEAGTATTSAEPDCDVSTRAEAADDGEDATFDDGFDAPQVGAGAAPTSPPPFADLTDAQLTERLRGDIGALGPMSIGRTHDGVLVAGVRMPEGANWELKSSGLAWATQESVDALAHAIDAVAEKFPGTPKLHIGDFSKKGGGHLPPHVSHQSGRDVDVGYYLTEGHRWYATANASNLDRARTWHLVRTLLADSDVDLILIDTQIQKLLKSYALESGEDPAWLDQIFQVGGKSPRPMIFHAKGHATHLHVRFYSPVAQELGRRAYRFLLARRLVSPPTLYVTHTVKKGETLSHLARRYKVTAEAIKKANALKKDTLRLDKAYKIPQTGGIAMPARVVVPPRRTPPPVKAAANPLAEPCRRVSAR